MLMSSAFMVWQILSFLDKEIGNILEMFFT